MMNIIVQWVTILSPIIAVGLAWWTSRSSAKDTAKQLAALEESTQKQVESMKKLAKTQIELTKIQLKIDSWNAKNRLDQKMKEDQYALDRQKRMSGVPMNEYTMRINDEREKKDRNLLEQDFYAKRQVVLSSYLESLKAIEFELNKD